MSPDGESWAGAFSGPSRITWRERGRLRRIASIACACLVAVPGCTPADLSSLVPRPSNDARFVTTRFLPIVSLVPGTGWRAILDAPGSLTLDDGDPPALRFVRVSAVFDPASQKVGKLPMDLRAWILSHPLLESRSPVPVTIGGIEGIQIDAEVVKAPKTPYEMRGRLCPIPSCVGLLVAGTIIDGRVGSVFRFILMEVDGQDLMIEIDSLGNDWAIFLPRVQAVLATVQFASAKPG
jgi:hypothetical protein